MLGGRQAELASENRGGTVILSLRQTMNVILVFLIQYSRQAWFGEAQGS